MSQPATQFMFSIDGGLTYQPCNGVRFIYAEASEDDDGFKDLHVNVTSEGIIMDVVDQASSKIELTSCADVDTLVSVCQ